MKVGNIIGGLEVVDVKQVNKLNLIQFLKEVDSYLQQGYQIDVKSGRQVGLVLQCKMFKTESASSGVGSTGVGVSSKEVEPVPEESVVTEKQRQDQLTKSVEEAKEALSTFTTPEQNDATVVKKTTTRSKKTAQ